MSRVILVSFVLIFTAVACNKEKEVATASPSSTSSDSSPSSIAGEATPEQLGEIGAMIRKNPQDAPRILKERGMDEATFAAGVRKVTENQESARRYTAAYRKAGGT